MNLNNHMIAKNHDIMQDLIKIVDMYLDVEERHYEEEINEGIDNEHIFHSLLNVSLFIKDNHTMKENIDES